MSQPKPSDYFWKYQYPPTPRTEIIRALLSFGFKQTYDDDVNTYFVREGHKVPVPNEEIIVSLPMYDIIQQISISGVSQHQFLSVLYPEELEEFDIEGM